MGESQARGLGKAHRPRGLLRVEDVLPRGPHDPGRLAGVPAAVVEHHVWLEGVRRAGLQVAQRGQARAAGVARQRQLQQPI